MDVYRYETRTLTLKDKHKFRVFKNKVLRKIFGMMRDERREWRILVNSELHALCPSNDINIIKYSLLLLARHVTYVFLFLLII